MNRVDSSISSKRVVINSNSESVNSASNGMCVVNVLNSVNATPTVRIVLHNEKQIWKPKSKLSDNSLSKTQRVWKATGKCRTGHALVSGLGLLKTYDGESFKAHEFCGKVHRVGQFCDSDLEVAFRKHTCFVRDLNGTDILKGSRGTNLYTISIDEMMKSSPICLLSKASKSMVCA
ncbi:hypothetical protein Tco_0687736 [Tanacetum coccineum]